MASTLPLKVWTQIDGHFSSRQNEDPTFLLYTYIYALISTAGNAIEFSQILADAKRKRIAAQAKTDLDALIYEIAFPMPKRKLSVFFL